MGKRSRYREHVDPEYRRWGHTYHAFPGVDECVRLIMDRKASGAWADIIVYELSEYADGHMDEMITAFRTTDSDDVRTYLLMAFEMAALPASVEFLSGVLLCENTSHREYARRALEVIDTKESRTALFNANQRDET